MSTKKKILAGSVGLGALGAMGAGLGIIASENTSNLQKLDEQNAEITSLKKQLEDKNKESNNLLQEIGALNESIDGLLDRNANTAGFYKKQHETLFQDYTELLNKSKDIELLEQQIEDMEEVDVVGHMMQCLADVRKTGELPQYLDKVDNNGENGIQHHNTILFNEIKEKYGSGEPHQNKGDAMLACYNGASVQVFSKFIVPV